MISWTDVKELKDYRSTFRKPGIYIIGGALDKNQPVTCRGDEDPYLQKNWPYNFTPYYIGISESNKVGVRGRLRSHFRRKGNKKIAMRILANETLYFIANHNDDIASYEALLLCLKTPNQFGDNVRPEVDRDASRRYRKVRESMTKFEQDYFDGLDYNGHGL